MQVISLRRNEIRTERTRRDRRDRRDRITEHRPTGEVMVVAVVVEIDSVS